MLRDTPEDHSDIHERPSPSSAARARARRALALCAEQLFLAVAVIGAVSPSSALRRPRAVRLFVVLRLLLFLHHRARRASSGSCSTTSAIRLDVLIRRIWENSWPCFPLLFSFSCPICLFPELRDTIWKWMPPVTRTTTSWRMRERLSQFPFLLHPRPRLFRLLHPRRALLLATLRPAGHRRRPASAPAGCTTTATSRWSSSACSKPSSASTGSWASTGAGPRASSAPTTSPSARRPAWPPASSSSRCCGPAGYLQTLNHEHFISRASCSSASPSSGPTSPSASSCSSGTPTFPRKRFSTTTTTAAHWEYLTYFLIVGKFMFPTIYLLAQDTKKSLRALTSIAVWILFMHGGRALLVHHALRPPGKHPPELAGFRRLHHRRLDPRLRLHARRCPPPRFSRPATRAWSNASPSSIDLTAMTDSSSLPPIKIRWYHRRPGRLPHFRGHRSLLVAHGEGYDRRGPATVGRAHDYSSKSSAPRITKTLTTADWVDRTKSIVRIPIDEAIPQEIALLKTKPVQMGAEIPGSAPTKPATAPAPTGATNSAPAAAAPGTNAAPSAPAKPKKK